MGQFQNRGPHRRGAGAAEQLRRSWCADVHPRVPRASEDGACQRDVRQPPSLYRPDRHRL